MFNLLYAFIFRYCIFTDFYCLIFSILLLFMLEIGIGCLSPEVTGIRIGRKVYQLYNALAQGMSLSELRNGRT